MTGSRSGRHDSFGGQMTLLAMNCREEDELLADDPTD